MRDPHDPTQWQPGDRFTYFPASEPFQLETMAGTVYVPPGTYGRFVMTPGGWMAEETHRDA